MQTMSRRTEIVIRQEKMEIDENIIVVRKLIELLKEDKLDKKHKNEVLKIIINMDNATVSQKDRFISFYGLKKEKQKLTEISKEYNCSSNAVRVSIITLKNKLSRSDFIVKSIKKIIKEYEK